MTRYGWKRYWHPRGADPILWDGFLLAPEPKSGFSPNQFVKSLDELEDVSCLVLLGEQGTGKSIAIQQLMETHSDDATWLCVDTRWPQSEARLEQIVFRDPKFAGWVSGSHQLHLVLDNLDGGPLPIEAKVRLLADELSRLRKDALSRLHLMSACQTSMWSVSLEAEITRFWRGNQVDVRELCPLREEDVHIMACDEGIHSEAFMTRVRERAVSVLAARPSTLLMLLGQYRRFNELPAGQRELMHDGCLTLCEDCRGDLDPQQRLAIAARLTATVAFSNKTGIWGGKHSSRHVDLNRVPIHVFCNMKERVVDNEFVISEAAVHEVLRTGLFRTGGDERIDCSQDFWDYLAAWYSAMHMSARQVATLLVNKRTGELVPQLQGVASWLAEMKPDLRDRIMHLDPEVFLLRDIGRMRDDECESLTSILISHFQQPGRYPPRGDYHCLIYPGLCDQLRPYVANAALPEGARYLAIAIAANCHLSGFQGQLVALALNASEPYYLRVRAAEAVAGIGDLAARSSLRPLLGCEYHEDPDDELRGYALQGLWPGAISADEMFAALTFPHNSHRYGAYQSFRTRDALSSLKPSDLPIALDWVIAQTDEHHGHWCDHLANGIISMAWGNLDEPGVATKLAEVLIGPLRLHEEIPIPSDREEDRRLVVGEMIEVMNKRGLGAWDISYHCHRMVKTTDLDWLISRLQSEQSVDRQESYRNLIRFTADISQAAQLSALLTACDSNPILRETMRPIIGPVELQSELAEHMRRDYDAQKRLFPESKTRRRRNKVLPSKEIQKHVLEAKAGELAGWWRVNHFLRFDEVGSEKYDAFAADITLFPGWLSADSGLKAELAAIAKQYIVQWDPLTSEWVGKSVIHYPAQAGYRAFHMLFQLSDGFVESLDRTIWELWTPTIIQGYTFDQTEAGMNLIELANSICPASVLASMEILLGPQNSILLHICDQLWDDTYADLVLGKLRNKVLDRYLVPEALRLLLVKGCSEGRTYIESMLELRNSETDDEKSLAVSAAVALVQYSDDGSWPLVKPPLLSDPEFGRRVVDALAHREHWTGVGKDQHLSADHIADLFICMEQYYPGEEGHRLISGPVGSADERYFWKSAAVNRLSEHGEVGALNRIRGECRDPGWIDIALLKAEDVARRTSWLAPEPDEILSLLDKPRVRLIQTGEDLLAVVEESLVRLQHKLHGETPIVDFLWDEWKGAWKPKSEAVLSNLLKTHLNEDLASSGIISSREVQIRPPIKWRRGQNTDILVQAIARGEHESQADVASVIIEVKGCWNDTVKTGMKTQLVDTYLRANQCQHGLYVIGWYKCDAWSRSDYRRKHAMAGTLADARGFFEDEADRLSSQSMQVRSLVLNATLG